MPFAYLSEFCSRDSIQSCKRLVTVQSKISPTINKIQNTDPLLLSKTPQQFDLGEAYFSYLAQHPEAWWWPPSGPSSLRFSSHVIRSCSLLEVYAKQQEDRDRWREGLPQAQSILWGSPR